MRGPRTSPASIRSRNAAVFSSDEARSKTVVNPQRVNMASSAPSSCPPAASRARSRSGAIKCTWQFQNPAVMNLPLQSEDLGTRGNFQLLAGADGGDAAVADQDGGVRERRLVRRGNDRGVDEQEIGPDTGVRHEKGQQQQQRAHAAAKRAQPGRGRAFFLFGRANGAKARPRQSELHVRSDGALQRAAGGALLLD